MNIAQFNYLEAGLWFLIATVLCLAAAKRGTSNPYFGVLVTTAVTFLVFGISDVIEAHTGAWWRPVGLLALKAICILMLLVLYRRYVLIKRHTNGAT